MGEDERLNAWYESRPNLMDANELGGIDVGKFIMQYPSETSGRPRCYRVNKKSNIHKIFNDEAPEAYDTMTKCNEALKMRFDEMDDQERREQYRVLKELSKSIPQLKKFTNGTETFQDVLTKMDCVANELTNKQQNALQRFADNHRRFIRNAAIAAVVAVMLMVSAFAYYNNNVIAQLESVRNGVCSEEKSIYQQMIDSKDRDYSNNMIRFTDMYNDCNQQNLALIDRNNNLQLFTLDKLNELHEQINSGDNYWMTSTYKRDMLTAVREAKKALSEYMRGAETPNNTGVVPTFN